MLSIIEGANYVGKTTTLDILKKKKSLITFYHPRFNDAQYYHFDYTVPETIRGLHVSDTLEKSTKATIHIPRDVVYQVSHMVCLKYLSSAKDKNILLDRCFLSEMVYNELYDKKIYEGFMGVLSSFNYKIFLLTVNNDEALRKRVVERLKKDATKRYGIRDSKGFVPEPSTIEEKMNSQRMIESKYKQFIECFKLNCLEIDTSDKTKKEVADIICKEIFKK
jgi:thymidylate kinase